MPDAVRFEIHYFYSGNHGADGIRLSAITLVNGKSLGYWGYVPGIVSTGDHTLQIRISLIPTAPSRHATNEIEFSFYGPNGVPFQNKKFPFTKEWINHNPKASPAIPPPTTSPYSPTPSTMPPKVSIQNAPSVNLPPFTKKLAQPNLNFAPYLLALVGGLHFILSVILIAFFLGILAMAVPFLLVTPPSNLSLVPSEPLLPAGFWRRVVGSLVDSLIFFIFQLTVGIGMAVAFWKWGPSAWLKRLPHASGGFGILLWWFYFAGFESSSAQATPGKRIVGIAVTDEQGQRLSFGRATGRTFAKYVSMLTFFIGYLMTAFTEKKQALHDMMAGCLVVQRGKSVLGRTVALTGAILLLIIAGSFLGIRYWLIPKAMGGLQRQLASSMLARPASGPLPEKIDTNPDIPTHASEADYRAAFATPAPPFVDGGGIVVGPALIKKDHFWPGDHPHFWIKIQLPNFPNHEKSFHLIVRHVWNAYHQDIYDPSNTFEKETFQTVNLMVQTNPSVYLSGIRDVYVMTGFQEQDVKGIEGDIVFRLPLDAEALQWDKSEVGQERNLGSVKVKMQSIKDSTVSVHYEGLPELRLKVMAFNAAGQPLSSSSSFWSTSGQTQNISCEFYGLVQRFKIYVASKLAEQTYPYSLNSN